MSENHTATYSLMKRTIETQKRKGTLNVEATLLKLDVFLMADRITAEEYQELKELAEKEDE